MIKSTIRLPLTLLLLLGCCACKHVPDTHSENVLLIGNVETLELRRLDASERVRVLGNGEISVTNTCGKAEITFDIETSTKDIGTVFSTKETIGEWCRSPYEFDKSYFLVIENNRVIFSKPVLHTESNLAVLYIDQDEIDELKEFKGAAFQYMMIKNFPDVVLHPEYPDPIDPDVRSIVQTSEALKIKKIEEKNYVVITKGVILKRIFPDLKMN